MPLTLTSVTANHRHDLLKPFDDALRRVLARDAVVKLGFAYVTLGGLQYLVNRTRASGKWHSMRKQVLVGLHHGITEPSALNMLQSMSNIDVRLFIPGGRLLPSALVAKPLFHAKVLAISSKDGDKLMFLQAGSANLTSSAISGSPQNHEFAIAIFPSKSVSIDREKVFNRWWLPIWNNSRRLTNRLINTYAELRHKILSENPILLSATEPASGIEKATYFFSEVGAGSGPPGQRHQIEFPRSLARFFGKVKRHRRSITLRRNNKTWPGRPLSYKRTTFDVEIWRLGMPTHTTGGDPVAGRAICFRRTNDPSVFEFEVADVGSEEFDDWVRVANINGHLGATHGMRSRQYGFF